MMTKQYIDDNMHTPELEQSLSQSKVLPMVKDLCYKYDLRVSQRLMIQRQNFRTTRIDRRFKPYSFDGRANDINYTPRLDRDASKTIVYEEGYTLTFKGIPQAVVYIDEEDRFCFRSSYEIKDRGYSDWDRHTITSNKVSQVIKTLKRKKWLHHENKTIGHYRRGAGYYSQHIDTQDMVEHYEVDNKSLKKAIQDLESARYTLTKQNTKYLEEVLESLYGSKNSISHETNEHLQREMNSLDIMSQNIQSIYGEVKAEFDNGFTAIGVCNNSGWVVGDAYEIEDDNSDGNVFKRYRSLYGMDTRHLKIQNTQQFLRLEDTGIFDSIIPTLTMLKVTLDDWVGKKPDERKIYRDYFKNAHEYGETNWIEDLGCYYQHNTDGLKNSPYDMRWLLIPKIK